MPKLIVIEGLNGSGKQTLTASILTTLINRGLKVLHIEYPRYGTKHAKGVEMYLAGDFGTSEFVGPYLASSHYAQDRAYDYKLNLAPIWDDYDIVIADRHTSANMLYQTSLLNEPADKLELLAWLEDLEFEKFCIPRPDRVFVIDLPPSEAAKGLADTGKELDMHEKDRDLELKVYNNLKFVADAQNWTILYALNENKIRKTTPELVLEVLNDLGL